MFGANVLDTVNLTLQITVANKGHLSDGGSVYVKQTVWAT